MLLSNNSKHSSPCHFWCGLVKFQQENLISSCNKHIIINWWQRVNIYRKTFIFTTMKYLRLELFSAYFSLHATWASCYWLPHPTFPFFQIELIQKGIFYQSDIKRSFLQKAHFRIYELSLLVRIWHWVFNPKCFWTIVPVHKKM